MEDEIFYYKEKVRELQTQNKWRETRKKIDQTKRQSVELTETLSGDEASKELRDVLERETDLKDQLRFTEEDLKRTQSRLHEVENENEELMQKLIETPMIRSVSEGNSQIRAALCSRTTFKAPSSVDTIEEGDEEQQQTTRRHSTQEAENFATAKKDPTDLNSSATIKLLGKENGPTEIKADFQVNNTEIEKDLGRLLSTINELKKKNSELQVQLKTSQANGDISQGVGNREKALSIELRKEQESKKEMVSELADYKQLIAKSDNNKLIAMATKVEILSNQLTAANERCQVLHKKNLKEATDTKYADSLKQHCEQLEKQISELKAKESFKVAKSSSGDQNNVPTTDEIEQCCVILASVDIQTNRICKLLEKMDMSQKEERRRSLTKDNYAVVVADLANIMTEIKMLNTVLETHKFLNNNTAGSNAPKSPQKEVVRTTSACSKCADNQKILDAHKDEIDFYKKKNKELTNQILQTEDRWTAEITKQTQEHSKKLKELENELEQTKDKLQEQMELADARSASIQHRDKSLEEVNSKIHSLNVELDEKRRQIQALEKDQKTLKEWEIKYKKLETIYEKRSKTVDELSKLRDGHQRREIMWNEERAKLEAEIQRLKEQDQPVNGDSVAPVVRSIPIRTINYRVTKMSDEPSGIPELKQKICVLEKKNEQLEGEVLSLRSIKEQLETELNKNRQVWEREKDSLTHKTRQDEKIRNVELDAAQQKFASRMNIMEQTNKSLHTQLVQTRREEIYTKRQLPPTNQN
uniref:Uncharacterized protein n=1 Tax=Ditylenchus dipsaci TaxID=166011 RepID=A0A915EG89_9BILA